MPSAAITAAITPIRASRSASVHSWLPAGAEQPRLGQEPGREPLDRGRGQRDDEREGEDRLRDEHDSLGPDQVERAERRLRQEQHEQEHADEHGRDREAHVGEDPQHVAAPEASEPDREPDRQADRSWRQRRDEGHLEREADDAEQRRVPVQDHRHGLAELVPDEPHLRPSRKRSWIPPVRCWITVSVPISTTISASSTSAIATS